LSYASLRTGRPLETFWRGLQRKKNLYRTLKIYHRSEVRPKTTGNPGQGKRISK